MANPWINHLQAYAKAHPEKSYKQCMKDAKASYKSAKKGSGLLDDLAKPVKFVNEFGKDMFNHADKHNVNKRGTLPNWNEFGINLAQNTLHAPEAIIKSAEKSGLIKKGKGHRKGKGQQGGDFIGDLVGAIPNVVKGQVDVFKKQQAETKKRQEKYKKDNTAFGDRVLNELKTNAFDFRPQTQLLSDLSKPVFNLGKNDKKGGSHLPVELRNKPNIKNLLDQMANDPLNRGIVKRPAFSGKIGGVRYAGEAELRKNPERRYFK